MPRTRKKRDFAETAETSSQIKQPNLKKTAETHAFAHKGAMAHKKCYKNLILPIPRSGNYMRFDELVEMLSKHGVQEKTIEQIHSEITASKIIDVT